MLQAHGVDPSARWTLFLLASYPGDDGKKEANRLIRALIFGIHAGKIRDASKYRQSAACAALKVVAPHESAGYDTRKARASISTTRAKAMARASIMHMPTKMPGEPLKHSMFDRLCTGARPRWDSECKIRLADIGTVDVAHSPATAFG